MISFFSPRQALNKAFLKLDLSWEQMTLFRESFLALLENLQQSGREDFYKNCVRDFFKKVYYDPKYFINIKNNLDFVIHTGKDSNFKVGVIAEFKQPDNKGEMPNLNKLNVKGLQQLLFYFLQERIIHKNLEVKHLIVSNYYEWFIFDAQEFERLFINDKSLVKQFTDFSAGNLSATKTQTFYNDIAKPAIAAVETELRFTYFDLRNYQNIVEKAIPDQELTETEEKELVELFKIFSPEHLLKLPFVNDSNSLNKEFYNELLHIIGLTETKQGSKKLIERKLEKDRDPGSLLESAIAEIENLGKLSRIERLNNAERFGQTKEEQLFNVALELVITWINRILFLKLLEAQLIRYHGGDLTFGFLNSEKLPRFYLVSQLFFAVLAKKIEDRRPSLQALFPDVPYLNSSLFEPTQLELEIIIISDINEEFLAIFPGTVLRDRNGNRVMGTKASLEYLLEFLDAYNFGSDGQAGIKKVTKSLINAPVLGLIFEKINGYKDGSFFTPGFITMYMCRETIRRAVIQKFNEAKGWNCQAIVDLYNKIEDIAEANQIINSLKICDPAAGSGHFLVSALNEIITIKSELGVLVDEQNKRLKNYCFEVVNDELDIRDQEGDLFEYNPKNIESQRIQKTIFHEKQALIENCLFGVDINENSVQICRLRLWIELLKNAYYKSPKELETLPNIDINVKRGNSLISRFALDSNLEPALRKSKLDVVTYRNAVQTYRNAVSKEQKQEMVTLIETIKGNFKTTLLGTDPNKTKLRQLEQELNIVENQTFLIEESKTEKKAREKKIIKLNNEIDKLKVEIEAVESGILYANALEWRFEFPEVLNNQGDFLGFDVVIGNPPYGTILNLAQRNYVIDNYLYNDYQIDIYQTFFELTEKIIKPSFFLCLIVPNTWLLNLKTPNIRKLLFSKFIVDNIRLYQEKVFAEAVVDVCIFMGNKNTVTNNRFNVEIVRKNNEIIVNFLEQIILLDHYKQPINVYESEFARVIKQKFSSLQKLDGIAAITQGTKPFQKGKGHPPQTQRIVDKKPFVQKYKKDQTFRPLLRGSLINKYSILWNNDYYISFGDWLAEPRYSANYDALKKVVVRQTGSALIAALDGNQFIVRDNLYTVISQNPHYSEEIILGLLNSNLLNWYYQNTINNEVGEALAQVKRGHLALLPFPSVNLVLFEQMNRFVNQIITAKKANPQANTTALEKEIDRLVYQLYNLTDEEIAIIENFQ